MVLSFALGLGVLFLSLYTQYATETVGVLFGSILSVSRANVVVTLGCGLAMLVVLAFMFRPLLFASVDPDVAGTRGVPMRALSILFLLLLAITVSVAVQVVGVLLVFALLVAPAATAERLTNRPGAAVALVVALGLAVTWGGLLLAFVGRWPVSFHIAVLAAFSYILAVWISSLRTPRHYRALPHPSREHI